jgi:hypothetical protein
MERGNAMNSLKDDWDLKSGKPKKPNIDGWKPVGAYIDGLSAERSGIMEKDESERTNSDLKRLEKIDYELTGNDDEWWLSDIKKQLIDRNEVSPALFITVNELKKDDFWEPKSAEMIITYKTFREKPLYLTTGEKKIIRKTFDLYSLETRSSIWIYHADLLGSFKESGLERLLHRFRDKINNAIYSFKIESPILEFEKRKKTGLRFRFNCLLCNFKFFKLS